MKIKRYLAATMREVLSQVRAEQGSEAVILSNRRVEGGIELITAVDYDERLLGEERNRAIAKELARTPAPVAPEPEPERAAPPAPPRAAKGKPAPARPTLAASQDKELLEMRREVGALKGLLEQQLASLTWSDALRREPARARLLLQFTRLGVAPDVARHLAATLPRIRAGAEASRLPLALILKHLPVAGADPLSAGGVVALVGPTGAGKTTSLAKLAARAALAHGEGSVALVSLDHDRIGAREQLLTYARLMGIPMHVAHGARELGAVLAGLRQRLVLVDTAGVGFGEALAAQVAVLAGAAPRLRVLLTLAANTEHAAMEMTVGAYARLRPEGLILTKTDETASLGSAFSVAMRHALPIAYVANGQRVPEDLHAAGPRRVWLVKKANVLAERDIPGRSVDEHELADRFGGAAAHA
jgi:flagellar biosynthesis protein FlhF